MTNYRITKGIVSGTMSMNAAAVAQWRSQGYTVTEIPATIIVVSN